MSAARSEPMGDPNAEQIARAFVVASAEHSEMQQVRGVSWEQVSEADRKLLTMVFQDLIDAGHIL